MRLSQFGPDGSNAVQRAYRRSPVRDLLRVSWTHRGLSDRDVMIASYPRSGNLWLRFMLFELLHGGASMERVVELMPYVGLHRRAPRLLPTGGRVIKTHELYRPGYRRAIHVVRDPRDIVVSYFKFLQRNGKLAIPRSMDEDAAFDRFVNAFVNGRLEPHGTWIGHLTSWTDARISGTADVVTVRYEDMRSDPIGTVGLIARWLGAEVEREEIARAVERCSIDQMKAATDGRTPPGIRPSPNLAPLVNAGLVGGWRDVLGPQQTRKFEAFADGLRLMGYAES